MAERTVSCNASMIYSGLGERYLSDSVREGVALTYMRKHQHQACNLRQLCLSSITLVLLSNATSAPN